MSDERKVYPTDDNPWKGGVQLHQAAEDDLPKPDSSGTFDYQFTIIHKFVGAEIKYKFVPQCKKHGDELKVLYYNAYNKTADRLEFAVSPGSVDSDFVKNLGTYHLAATNFYGFFKERPKYEVETYKFQYAIFTGQPKAALRALGKSWLAALQDPGWWATVAMTGNQIANTLQAPKPPAIKPPTVKPPTPPATGALARLQNSVSNLLGKSVTRSSAVLSAPQVVRQSLTGRIPAVDYVGIEKSGLRVSTGANAHYGPGAYAWAKDAAGVGKYVDVELPTGVAVETLTVDGKVFYRIVGSSGDYVPAKIVGSNLTAEEIALGRKIAASGD